MIRESPDGARRLPARLGRLVATVCILVVVPVLARQAYSAGAPPPEETIGLQLAMEKSLHGKVQLHAASSGARQVVATNVSRAVTGEPLGYAVKVLDDGLGLVDSYWYDRRVDTTTEESLFAERATSHLREYGRLSPGLFERLQTTAANSDVPVAIWVEQALGASLPSSGAFRVFLPYVARQGAAACSAGTDCVAQFLLARGYSPDRVSSEAPVVYATLPAGVISELQLQPYVAAVYAQAESQPTLDTSARTAAAPWTWERGISGTGIKVAVLEGDAVALDNPYITGSHYYDARNPDVCDPAACGHATQVAGVIASTHPTYRGIAYGAEILSANAGSWRDGDITAAADWAVNNGADVINASIGQDCGDRKVGNLDKYLDWLVWNKRKTVVVSAGNVRTRCPNNYNVATPGKGYNVLTVGSKDDNNTASTEADTGDDQFSDFSQYIDPDTSSERRLKPEVIAVGEKVRTTGPFSPWIESSETQGTSFAAPVVSGQAALMMQRASWLRNSPEAVKAGIMATARWTYARDDANWSQWASSDKIGVGAVDVTAADNSLINGRIQQLELRETDFPSGYYEIAFNAEQGQRVRVVITWPSHPAKISIVNWILFDHLESDFDLMVLGPGGQGYGSFAYEANYEIVDFTATATGTYRARILPSRWDNSSTTERVGFAWYSGFPLP